MIPRNNIQALLSSRNIILAHLSQAKPVRPGAYPRVEHLQGALLGEALALPAIIRLGWKGLPVTNTLAYYERS